MLTDQYHNPISAASEEAVAAMDDYAAEFLGYGPGLGRLPAVAEAHPNCLSLQAHAAAVHMALEAASGFRAARPFLARARAVAGTGTARERAFLDGVEAWARGDIGRAARLFTGIAQRWPSDLIAAKWAQYHAFNKGDTGLMAEAAEAILLPGDERPFVWGIQAFVKEQLHDIRGAEEAARRAIAIRPDDAWAHHALAHVMETEGRLDEGIAFLNANAAYWADRGVFIREHNYWHLGLFHLDKDEPDKVLDIYDRRLWGEWPEFAQEQIGAISALWRLELRGVDVGDRWRPVAAKVAERELEHVLPFHDLHYVYALARGGEAARLADMLASMAARAAAPGPEQTVWRDVALPAAKALAALGQGQHGAGAHQLAPLLARMQQIGGSHAQRDLFHQAHIDALVRAGEGKAAIGLIDKRVQSRPAASALRRLLTWAREAAFA